MIDSMFVFYPITLAPNGIKESLAILKNCLPNGIPTIVIHHMHPAKTQAKPPSNPEIPSILHCLSGQIRSFSKGEMIFCAGESITSVGIVLEGSVHIEIDDFWGSKNILNHVGPGQLFGEAYACSPSEPLMVNVVSVTPSQILFLDVPKILHTCEKPCSHHQQMIENLLRIMATSNLQLSRRILHTTPKTIRERLLAYLSYQELLIGSPEITIAFNRQQLADYLSVDRSALSKEIGKMQKDGLLEVKKNKFVLKSRE